MSINFNKPYYKVLIDKRDRQEFEEIAKTKTRRELAEIYKIPYSRVCQLCLYYEINSKKCERKLIEEKFNKDFIESHTLEECMEEYKCSSTCIRQYCRNNKIKLRQRKGDKDIAKWAQTYNKGRIRGVYYDMLKRCNKPSCSSYKDYGGRGIKVCSEWERNCRAFYKWAKDTGYKEGLQLDRIDNNGNYTSSNCRWVTPRDNAYNKRNTRLITLKNETHTLLEWSIITGVPKDVIADRIYKYKWSIERALTEEVHYK